MNSKKYYMDHSQILLVEEKLQKLLTRYKRLQKENATLKDALHLAQRDLAQSKNTIADLQQRIDIKNLGVQELDENRKIQLSQRIDVYIKEINESLALLNA